MAALSGEFDVATEKVACFNSVGLLMDRNLTILVAEDSEDYGFLLERSFRDVGLKNPVRILTDGAEVLAYLKGEGKYADRLEFTFPSVLFIDLKMPGVSGFDILEWMQEHPESGVVPRIVLTSSDYAQDVARAYELGAHAYFMKPAHLTGNRVHRV